MIRDDAAHAGTTCQVRKIIRKLTEPADNDYKPADAAVAWDRRRRDLQHLVGITDVLTDVERRADELNRRAAELLDGWL